MEKYVSLGEQTQEEKSRNLFAASLHELKDLRNVVFCGLLGAMAIALDQFTTIKIGEYIRIGFSGYPNRMCDYLFGPVTGAIFGAVMDILKFMVKPDGMFNPLFTLVPVVAALICGVFWYRKKVTIWRVAIAQLLVKVICNIFLNTWFISITGGKAMMAIIGPRIIRNLVMWPIDTVFMFVVLTAIERAMRGMRRQTW